MFIVMALALSFLLGLGLKMGLEWFKNSWYFVIQSIIGFLTLGVLYFQYKHDKLMEKFTIFPNVVFYLISGRTDFFKQTGKPVNEFSKTIPNRFFDVLDSRFLVLNHSKFPITFRLGIELKIENENGGTKLIQPYKHNWDFDPGEFMNGHDSGQMLCKDVLGDKFNENISEQDFRGKVKEEKIKNIFATTKFSCSPHANKKLILKGILKTWRFDLEELIWVAPKGIKDYLISIKGYY